MQKALTPFRKTLRSPVFHAFLDVRRRKEELAFRIVQARIPLAIGPMGQTNSDAVIQVFAHPLGQLLEQCTVARHIHDNCRQTGINLIKLIIGIRVLIDPQLLYQLKVV